MPISCDPQSLADSARCFESCIRRAGEPVKTYLLCQWSNSSSGPVAPDAPTNPDIQDGSSSDHTVFTWTNPNPAGTTNEIWKSTDGGMTFVLYASVAGANVSYVDAAVMNVGDFWTYKVRACNSAGCSAFSDTRSVTNNLDLSGQANVVVSFPDLVFAYTSLTGINMPNVTSISFPLLRAVTGLGSFQWDHNSKLVNVSAPLLTTVGIIDFSADTLLPSLSLPSLITCPDISFGLTPALTAIHLDSVVTFTGNVSFGGLVALTTFTAPSCTLVVGDFNGFGSGLTSLSLPLLATIQGGFLFSGCAAITTISLPALSNVVVDFVASNCTSMTTLTLTSLQTVTGSSFDISNCPSLTTLSLPAGITVGQNFLANDCTVLSNVSIPVLVFQSGFLFDFQNCAIAVGNSAAGTGINGILRRGVVSATAGSDYELAGGTNAVPGATGLADKATLITAGNTVVTN